MVFRPRSAASVCTAGDTPWAEKTTVAPVGHLVELLDEDRASGLQGLDHMLVVHDLLAHVDGRPVEVQRLLDGDDGAIHPGAVPAGGCDDDALDGRGNARHADQSRWWSAGTLAAWIPPSSTPSASTPHPWTSSSRPRSARACAAWTRPRASTWWGRTRTRAVPACASSSGRGRGSARRGRLPRNRATAPRWFGSRTCWRGWRCTGPTRLGRCWPSSWRWSTTRSRTRSTSCAPAASTP